MAARSYLGARVKRCCCSGRGLHGGLAAGAGAAVLFPGPFGRLRTSTLAQDGAALALEHETVHLHHLVHCGEQHSAAWPLVLLKRGHYMFHIPRC